MRSYFYGLLLSYLGPRVAIEAISGGCLIQKLSVLNIIS